MYAWRSDPAKSLSYPTTKALSTPSAVMSMDSDPHPTAIRKEPRQMGRNMLQVIASSHKRSRSRLRGKYLQCRYLSLKLMHIPPDDSVGRSTVESAASTSRIRSSQSKPKGCHPRYMQPRQSDRLMEVSARNPTPQQNFASPPVGSGKPVPVNAGARSRGRHDLRSYHLAAKTFGASII